MSDVVPLGIGDTRTAPDLAAAVIRQYDQAVKAAAKQRDDAILMVLLGMGIDPNEHRWNYDIASGTAKWEETQEGTPSGQPDQVPG